MSRDRDFLLLHAAVDALHLVRARPAGDSVRLAHVCTIPAEDGTGLGSALLSQPTVDALALKIREEKLIGRPVVIAVSGPAVSPNYLELPPLSGKALRQAVALKLEQQIHFPVEESIVAIAAPAGGKTPCDASGRLHATAARRELIDAAVRFAAAHRLKLLGICAVADALAAAAAASIDGGPGLCGVLHFDERHSTLIVFADGSPCACADIAVGAADLTAALMRPIISGDDVFQLDEEKARQIRDTAGIPGVDDDIEGLGVKGDRVLPLIEPILQKISKQLTQWLTFASTSTGRTVGMLQVIGPGAAIKGFTEAVAARTSIEMSPGPWFDRLAELTGEHGGQSGAAGPETVIETAGVCAAAALHYSRLPDLVPPEVRQDQRIHRVRRSVLMCGPVVAAACLALGLTFARLGAQVRENRAACERRLVEVQRTLGGLTGVARAAQSLRGLEERFADFARFGPHWTALFKELSLLLPPELQAMEYKLESRPEGFSLTVEAAVFVDGRGRDFDEIVRQSLLLLQRSALFRRVELVSANRETQKRETNLAGVMSIQLDLVHPRPRAGA